MTNKNVKRGITGFHHLISAYGNRNGRHHLPWRQTKDPYAILVSEVMLQQTQVERVIPYFEKWMKKFPTVERLASSPLASVLQCWSGLGYNRRAMFLHEAAKQIVARHGASVPRSYEDLRALPGVGDYTAKAVRVFVFSQPEVLIETNVRTVFLHHFFPRSRKVSDKKLLPLIEATLKGQDPAQWYAALMDYGTFLKAMHPNPSRRSKHHTKQSKFEGSLRQVRGAIVRAVLKGDSLNTVRRTYVGKFDRAFQALVREKMLPTMHSP